MTIRNVYKNFAGMEDIQQGIGQVEQTRGESNVFVGSIDVPYAVNSQAELTALDVERFTRARVYNDVTDYFEYIYDANDLSGIQPDEGPGSWIFVSLDYASLADLNDISSTVNTVGKYRGKQIFMTDQNRPVWSVGATDGSVWQYADGTTAATPV